MIFVPRDDATEPRRLPTRWGAVLLIREPFDPVWEIEAQIRASAVTREARGRGEGAGLGSWETEEAVSIARQAICGWEGVLWDDGQPVECTPDNVERMLRRSPGVLADWRITWRMLAGERRAEGNGSVPSPAGTLAEGQDTAPTA